MRAKKSRKVLSVFLSLLMLLPMTALFSASADDTPVYVYKRAYAGDLLAEAIRDGKTKVYIPNAAEYDYDPSNIVFDLRDFSDIDESFLTFNYASEITVGGYSGYVSGYNIYYRQSVTLTDGTVLTAAEAAERAKAFYDGLAAGIPAGLDDQTKVMILNNRLCEAVEYDDVAGNEISHSGSGYQYHNYSQRTQNSAGLLGPALEGMAVCEGYSLAFLYLCCKVGVPCRYSAVRYKGGAHGVNIVTIDGKEYIVDVTHNDGGKNNWLLSSAYKYNAHCNLNATDQLFYITDDRYDDAWWTWYTADNMFWSNGSFWTLKSLDYSGSEGARVAILRDGVQVDEYSTFWFEDWTQRYSFIRYCSGDAFYYNVEDAVWKYDCRTGQKTEFFKPTLPEGKKIVYFEYDGLTLSYAIADQSMASDLNALWDYMDDPANRINVGKYDPDMHCAAEFAQESDCQHKRAVGVKCAVCGTVLTPAAETEEYGPHKGEWTSTATCAAAGTESRVCEICGETETRPAPAKGHNYSNYIAANIPTQENCDVNATCQQAGRKMALTCADCGYVKPAETVTGGDHSYQYFYTDMPLGYASCTAACTIPGVVCTLCSQEFSQPEDYPEGLGHIPVPAGEDSEPTCTGWGYKARRVCERCHLIVEQASDIKPLGHVFVTLDPPEVHPATCTEDKTTITEKCSRCGAVTRYSYAPNSRGHIDANGDSICDDCGIAITAETKMRGQSSSGDNGGGSQGGSSGGGFFDSILNFFRRIIQFFRNLFSR